LGIAVQGTAATANASPTRGWIAGHFAIGIAQTTELEIKLWHYDRSPTYPQKAFAGVECIIVEHGVLQLDAVLANGTSDTFVLDGAVRSYVILPAGTLKTVKVLEVPAFGVTVRWPSSPLMKSGVPD
jgi:hypothetical protein